MTRPCPSNRQLQVIFSAFGIYVHCVNMGVVYMCLSVRENLAVHLLDHMFLEK